MNILLINFIWSTGMDL